MTGARQTIAVIMTFRKYDKNCLERRTGSYRSRKKKHPVVVDVSYNLLISNEDSGGKQAHCVWFVPRRQFLSRWSVVIVFFYMRISFRKFPKFSGVIYRISLVPDRNRRIFRAKISSARLPSEGK